MWAKSRTWRIQLYHPPSLAARVAPVSCSTTSSRPQPNGLLVGRRPHPRAWGTFARYLAEYVRESGVLTLQECVRKITSLPAARLGLVDRGTVRPPATRRGSERR